ncbi:hypothetical protein [Hymenobacter sp. AT01-02]|uniref:hypothetical protein n=1 Tax=Hymenobacter sp. AT01-02 TaxID=1571877 RepID=UPI0006E24ECB|nr:hypothetical protein [Hymenobacter sp. AT01-02]
MALYLSRLELQARLHIGKEAEQWIGYTNEDDYTVIKWIYLAQEDRHQYSVNYVESFDEGDEHWQQVPEFSLLDPDAEESAVFDSVEEAVNFAVHTYGASPDRFIPGGMLAAEYATYWQQKSPSV